ncbi:MAG: hypothetical protein CMF46_03775 [Legionellales bacterium]|nr:hypothetical protein [Legionellales bacterium]
MTVVFTFITLIFFLIWLYTYLSLAKTRGVSELPGLKEGVDIHRDAHGVPHIHANHNHDLYFALGYLHAQDRIWQLELQRRVCTGALSEVFGAGMLDTDKLIRTLDFVGSSRQSVSHLSKDDLDMIDAYAQGINAWINEGNWLPIEFYCCGVKPKIWRKIDVLAWSKMMSWTLSANWQSELMRAKMLCSVGEEKTKQLMGVEDQGASLDIAKLSDNQLIIEKLLDMLKIVNSKLGYDLADLGSNNWVISGQHTKTGKPILACDPHLGATIPSVWYLAALKSKDLSLAGATLPGLPAVIIGHNDHITWGITNTYADCQDLVINSVGDDVPETYLRAGVWETFEQVEEIIMVRGEMPIRYTRRYTKDGPVVSDLVDPNGKTSVTLCWTALDGSDTTVAAFARVNSAKNWQDFRAALTLFVSPSQNFVYADIDGNIGYQFAGKVPVRSQGTGQVPSDGAKQKHWQSYIPFEELPSVYNPDDGFIATANNHVVSQDYPYFISQEWAPDYRHQRIVQQFLSMTNNGRKISLGDVKKMQLDHTSLVAQKLLPYFVQLPPSSMNVRQALEYLLPWSGVMSIHKVAPTIFNMWYRELVKLYLLSDIDDSQIVDDYLSSRYPIFCVERVLELFVSSSDETGKITNPDTLLLLKNSFDEAIDLIESLIGNDMDMWQWGKIHTLHFAHSSFDQMAWFRQMFSRTMASPGDPYTVNVGSYNYAKPFVQSGHASYRQIISLSNWNDSLYVQTVGQSGNVFSQHYDDLFIKIKHNEYIKMWFESHLIPNSKRLQLLPKID